MRTITHKIAIPTILEVGNEALKRLGKLIARHGFKKVLLVYGEGLDDLFGKEITNSLHTSNVEILKQYEGSNSEVCAIVKEAFAIPAETNAVIGVGGGKALDIAKYIAFLTNLPFISVPTSTSNDGFASSSCSLIVDGKRTTVAAKMPFGIIVDINIIKNSPDKFIYSGIGDLISKITAVYDWLFEEHNNKATVDAFAIMIAKKSVNSVVRTNFESIRDDFFIKELIDSLTMSGIAMEMAGSSAPASGSEHLISHALDKFVAIPQLHGVQVGIATYIMSKTQGHRYQRVESFLTDTGFLKFAKEAGMRKADFAAAIDIAPTIKPHRYTFIHLEEHRERAKRLLYTDPILQEVLV